MTYDLIVDRQAQLHRLVWIRFAVAAAMVATMVVNAVVALLLDWPAVVYPAVAAQTGLGIALVRLTAALGRARLAYHWQVIERAAAQRPR